MKSSPFSRSIELAKIAAKVGLKELKSSGLKSRMEQALVLAEGLSKLKGAAMKAGQLLSMELGDYFPPEAVQILSKLQNSASQIDFSIIDKIIRNELGRENFAKIKNLEEAPIGTASIGQVHRAELVGGKKVIFKVQYPEVAESIDSDLSVLKKVASAFCSLTGRDMDLDPLFSEFKKMLTQEVDYMKEADFQIRYSQGLKNISNSLDSQLPMVNYIVPKVEIDLTTHKVLCMEYLQGVPLREWIKSTESQAKKEKMAKAFLDLYFFELFEMGIVQTDPNWANFLVREEKNSFDLILLDFGATKEYDKDFLTHYTKLLQAISNEDDTLVRKIVIEFKLIDPRESDEAFTKLAQLVQVAIRPFFVSNKGIGSGRKNKNESRLFSFGDQDHALASQDAAKELAKVLKYSPPPQNLIFLHRKLAGVYSILKFMHVELDVTSYWQKMTEWKK